MIKRVLVGILLLVIAGAALWWVSGRQDAASPPSPAAESPVGAPMGAMPAIPPDAFEMTVESVHDGDTLRAHVTTPNEVVADPGSTRIRLLGVDTPEISPEPECWGAQATATLTSLAPAGSTIWVTADSEPRDQYGRTLLYVWTSDGRFVNGELVARGDARVEVYSPNREHEATLRSLESAAVAAAAGRWGACG